jgi:hypothetical protein
MNNESIARSRPRETSWNVVLKWMAVLAAHFRVELSEPELKIYCASLQRYEPEKIERAMQRCLEECQFIPKIHDIKTRLVSPDGFVVTTSDYRDPQLDALDREVFKQEMEKLRVSLDVKPKIVRERNTEPFPKSTTDYVAMVGLQTLEQWAASQSLDDSLPRTKLEIELIKQVKKSRRREVRA